MENFHFLEQVGKGFFGEVWKACDKRSGQLVAIKVLRQKSPLWENCMNQREVKSLKKMNHPNIVKFHEVFKYYDSLYLVMEYMPTNLSNVIKQRQQRGHFFSEREVSWYCFHILQGLYHMHQKGYFHRDLKPANLLLSGNEIKIADFGMAKEINSKSPHTARVTDRSYRAPEMILSPKNYDRKVDMWAVGAIMAEMIALRPIFHGEDSSKVMVRICNFLGPPTTETWPEGLRLARRLNYQFPRSLGWNLSMFLRSPSNDAISLILWLCSWDPRKRPRTLQALQHPFFTNNGFCAPCG